MLKEFKAELATNPYFSKSLSTLGRRVFPEFMERAIKEGSEETLRRDLLDRGFWKTNSGRANPRTINPLTEAKKVAITEFNTWYVRGFARRLIEEGESLCEVYRAAPAEEPRTECRFHHGRQYPVQQIYEGHRARYWPEPGNPRALSIPVGPNCHHTIRRIKRL